MDIAIDPIDGEFDLPQIEAALLAIPNVARVPKRAMKFMLAPDVETLEHSLVAKLLHVGL